MNTKAARSMAESRHAFMEDFLKEWADETDGTEEAAGGIRI